MKNFTLTIIAAAGMLPLTPLPARASCEYTVNNDYACITQVTANKAYPYLNTVYGSMNGQPIMFAVDCSDFTANFGAGWFKYSRVSIIHTVCTEWSF